MLVDNNDFRQILVIPDIVKEYVVDTIEVLSKSNDIGWFNRVIVSSGIKNIRKEAFKNIGITDDLYIRSNTINLGSYILGSNRGIINFESIGPIITGTTNWAKQEDEVNYGVVFVE